MAKKAALGKGLSALIKPTKDQHNSLTTDENSVQYLPITSVIPSPHNPRKNFTTEEIQELANSIKEHGIIQPLIVRAVGGNYELIAGERRWRASQSISLKTVPAIVRHATDRDVIEMALIENLQRQDLNPIEEAAGYLRLAKEFHLTQEQIAKQVGKARATVANALRLLDLQEPVQAFLANGQLSVGHAKALLSVKDNDQQYAIADQIIRHKLTVRKTEKAISELGNPTPTQGRLPNTRTTPAKTPQIKGLQQSLSDHFATQVTITDNGKKGKIELEFYGKDDLKRVLEVLGINDTHL